MTTAFLQIYNTKPVYKELQTSYKEWTCTVQNFFHMIGYAEPGGDEGNRQNFQSASKVIRPENTN